MFRKPLVSTTGGRLLWPLTVYFFLQSRTEVAMLSHLRYLWFDICYIHYGFWIKAIIRLRSKVMREGRNGKVCAHTLT